MKYCNTYGQIKNLNEIIPFKTSLIVDNYAQINMPCMYIMKNISFNFLQFELI